MKTKALVLAGIMLLMSLSLVAQVTESLLLFDISPNPMKEYCDISLEYSGDAIIEIQVLDEKGDTVKTIYNGPIHKSGRYRWLRDDALGNWVEAGTYFVEVQYQSRYTSTKKTLILK
ncbi:MAG: hypothetical protein PHO85_01345 [Candidatus Cloacimonetes bacterium]|jgi:hypothetical protein|nr:hypothetical protein [Candidatus Cloacimonadota bacterium]MDD2506491.1 hypothetical protein [Candidatus Cloacimonadota bacterium]MDD4147146.1 hypothetical protein [Candidatus Cloacimonadota bacterium]MDD4560560.1 hypothetical protein [Candidatus Cloacimonadota bacterium]